MHFQTEAVTCSPSRFHNIIPTPSSRDNSLKRWQFSFAAKQQFKTEEEAINLIIFVSLLHLRFLTTIMTIKTLKNSNSLHLAIKYKWMFVYRHYFAPRWRQFLKSKAWENCELQGTNNGLGQIFLCYMGVMVYYPSNIFSNAGGRC